MTAKSIEHCRASKERKGERASILNEKLQNAYGAPPITKASARPNRRSLNAKK
jgi:hypothetical protein